MEIAYRANPKSSTKTTGSFDFIFGEVALLTLFHDPSVQISTKLPQSREISCLRWRFSALSGGILNSRYFLNVADNGS